MTIKNLTCDQGHANPPNAKFCLNCGQSLIYQYEKTSQISTSAETHICSQGYFNPSNAEFCLDCGESLLQSKQYSTGIVSMVNKVSDNRRTCSQGHLNSRYASFFLNCGQPLIVISEQSMSFNNNSGHGRIFDESMPVSPGIKGWNWGAFLLTPIWSAFNKVWIRLLAFIPYVGFRVSIWMGLKGNELAWKSKCWVNVNDFKEHQRKWAIAGFIAMGVCFFPRILIAAMS